MIYVIYARYLHIMALLLFACQHSKEQWYVVVLFLEVQYRNNTDTIRQTRSDRSN